MNKRFCSILMALCVLSGFGLSSAHLLSHVENHQHQNTHCDQSSLFASHHAHSHHQPTPHERNDQHDSECELCLLTQQFSGGWHFITTAHTFDCEQNSDLLAEYPISFDKSERSPQSSRGPPLTV